MNSSKRLCVLATLAVTATGNAQIINSNPLPNLSNTSVNVSRSASNSATTGNSDYGFALQSGWAAGSWDGTASLRSIGRTLYGGKAWSNTSGTVTAFWTQVPYGLLQASAALDEGRWFYDPSTGNVTSYDVNYRSSVVQQRSFVLEGYVDSYSTYNMALGRTTNIQIPKFRVRTLQSIWASRTGSFGYPTSFMSNAKLASYTISICGVPINLSAWAESDFRTNANYALNYSSTATANGMTRVTFIHVEQGGGTNFAVGFDLRASVGIQWVCEFGVGGDIDLGRTAQDNYLGRKGGSYYWSRSVLDVDLYVWARFVGQYSERTLCRNLINLGWSSGVKTLQ